MRDLIEELLKKKIEKIPTIKEFCNLFQISFVALSFNYTDNIEFTISKKNSPELNLLDALQMTSNIPFVFQPFHHQDKIFFDGFLTNNYPINKIDIDHDIALGIYCDSKHKKNSTSTWNFVWDIILIPLIQLQKTKIDSYYDQITNINLDASKLFDLDHNLLTVTKILDAYSDAFMQTDKIMSSKPT